MSPSLGPVNLEQQHPLVAREGSLTERRKLDRAENTGHYIVCTAPCTIHSCLVETTGYPEKWLVDRPSIHPLDGKFKSKKNKQTKKQTQPPHFSTPRWGGHASPSPSGQAHVQLSEPSLLWSLCAGGAPGPGGLARPLPSPGSQRGRRRRCCRRRCRRPAPWTRLPTCHPGKGLCPAARRAALAGLLSTP